LIHCDFSKNVWNRLLHHFSVLLAWKGDTISNCFSSWLSKKTAPHSLAAHVCWQTWIERNQVIFYGRSPSSLAVFHRILTTFHWQPSSIKPFPIKACEFKMAQGYTLACFDDVA
jgi:hypothetical protein